MESMWIPGGIRHFQESGGSTLTEDHSEAEPGDHNLDREADDSVGAIEIVPCDYYELRPMFTKSTKRFGANYGQYDLIFKNMEKVADVELVLLAIFTDVLEEIKADGNDDDLLSFFLNHPILNIPIIVPLRRQSDLTAEAIVDEIMNVLQSKKFLTFDDTMTVYFTRIKRPAGSGRMQRKYNTNMEEYLRKKRAIIEIINGDQLCCARAIVTAKARIDDDRYETIRKGDRNGSTLQRDRARLLMEQAGLSNHLGPCGPEEWMALQAVLGHGQYQLQIFDKDTFNSLVYIGPDAPKVLHLWLSNDHFHVVTSPASFFETKYFCESCNKAYDHPVDHQICPDRCHCCFGMGKCVVQYPLRKCHHCHRFFSNPQCFLNHLKCGSSKKNKQDAIPVCKRVRRCETCRKEYYARKDHQCFIRQCRTCKLDVIDSDHACFIQPYHRNGQKDDEDPLADPVELLGDGDEDEDDGENTGSDGPPRKKRKVTPLTSFIFYDFECRQDETIGENNDGYINLHRPNLVIAHKVCEQCCKQATLGPCANCKENRRVFKGDSCLDQFCQWLFSKQNKNSIAIAHNAKGYDGQFILEYCHRQGIKPKQIISRGLGVMFLEVGGIKFKDSLNFLPMALSALPKAFDVPECKKGYFPHMFNRLENWDYVGIWPRVEYYQPEVMKPDEREKFLQWYQQQQGKQFDFQEEITSYCESDVTVLRLCCLKFRQMFMDIGHIDPFVESITIASACNKFYRMHHMPINRIAVVPHGGYRKAEKQSIVALKWLKWLSHSMGQRIQYKLNGGEAQIGPWRVDGLCGRTVYEFNGCYWHGCKNCMKKRTHLTADGIMTASEAFQRTADRRRDLETMGYTIIEKWECQLQNELKQNHEMAEFFNNVKIMDPLDAREAFFGGRTNATVLYHKVKEGEQIRYIDVLSLYPYICKYGIFPVGHPKIITDNFDTMDAHNTYALSRSHQMQNITAYELAPPRASLPVKQEINISALRFLYCKTPADAMRAY